MSDEKEVKWKYAPLADEEARRLAMDIADDRVFLSIFVKEPKDVGMVFMAAALGGLAHIRELLTENPDYPKGLKTPLVLYDYLSEAGPRSVNGYPCFMSHKLLLGDDVAGCSTSQKILRRRRRKW